MEKDFSCRFGSASTIYSFWKDFFRLFGGFADNFCEVQISSSLFTISQRGTKWCKRDQLFLWHWSKWSVTIPKQFGTNWLSLNSLFAMVCYQFVHFLENTISLLCSDRITIRRPQTSFSKFIKSIGVQGLELFFSSLILQNYLSPPFQIGSAHVSQMEWELQAKKNSFFPSMFTTPTYWISLSCVHFCRFIFFPFVYKILLTYMQFEEEKNTSVSASENFAVFIERYTKKK